MFSFKQTAPCCAEITANRPAFRVRQTHAPTKAELMRNAAFAVQPLPFISGIPT